MGTVTSQKETIRTLATIYIEAQYNGLVHQILALGISVRFGQSQQIDNILLRLGTLPESAGSEQCGVRIFGRRQRIYLQIEYKSINLFSSLLKDVLQIGSSESGVRSSRGNNKDMLDVVGEHILIATYSELSSYRKMLVTG